MYIETVKLCDKIYLNHKELFLYSVLGQKWEVWELIL